MPGPYPVTRFLETWCITSEPFSFVNSPLEVPRVSYPTRQRRQDGREEARGTGMYEREHPFGRAGRYICSVISPNLSYVPVHTRTELKSSMSSTSPTTHIRLPPHITQPVHFIVF